MKKVLYILFLLSLLASCTKYDLLQPIMPKGSGAGNNNPIDITDPDKDDDHDTDAGGITDPDKDGDHDQDATKSLGALN